MIRSIQLTAILAVAGSCSGCLAIPTGIFYDEDFQRIQVSLFENEQASREDVLFALGMPDSIYRDNDILLYRISKTSVAVGVYGGGGGEWRQFQWLLVEFDDSGQVIGHYPARNMEGVDLPCFSNDLCLGGSERRYVLLETEQRSTAARQPISSGCVVYYLEEPGAVGGVYIDDMPFSAPSERGFRRWSVLEGTHVLRRTGLTMRRLDIERLSAESVFECQLGEVYYFLGHTDHHFLSSSQHLERLDSESGQAALDGRRLLVER